MSAPSSEQIQRACRVYSAGIDVKSFREMFSEELDAEGVVLLWAAALTCAIVDERWPMRGR